MLKLEIYCDDQSSLHLQLQYKYQLFDVYFTIQMKLCIDSMAAVREQHYQRSFEVLSPKPFRV